MSEPGEWSFVAVHDVVAAAAPERDMVVCGQLRRSFGDVAERTRSLAAFLRGRGVGLHTERNELERWESGQDPVALVLHNGTEYIEAMLGAFRARAVPCNVNQHYRPAEVQALLADVGVKAIVYHRRYRPLVETALAQHGDIVLIDVDDGSGTEPLPGSTPFEEAARTPVTEPLPETSPDDLYLVCTGGTTGRPKAVLWRQADIYVSALAGVEGATAESITEAVTAGTGAGGPWYPVAPLMHAAAQWTAFSGLNQGATVVVHEDTGSFDAAAVLS
jgi:fatty-acyl-CoA synthase